MSIFEEKGNNFNYNSNSYGNNNSRIEFRLRFLETALQNLQANTADHAPVSHQLADHVTGLIGLKEALTVKNKILKLIWALLFCLGIGGTILFLYSAMSEYLANPTLTKVQLEKDLFYDYPPIVLCPNAWFDVEKAVKNYHLSIDGFKYSLGYWGYSGQLNLTNLNTARQNFSQTFHKYGFTSLIDFYKAIATDMEPEYVKESFYKNPASAYLAVKERPLAEKVFLPFYPVCHSFQLQPVEARLGVLFVPEMILLKFMDKTNGLITTTPDWNLQFSTDGSNMYVWPLIIRSSTNTLLKIKAQKFIVLNRPEAPCVPVEQVKINYTSAACMTDCGSRLFQEVLHCQLLYLSAGTNRHPPGNFCNTLDPSETNSSGESEQRFLIQSKVKEICYEQCPPKCERMMYEATVEGENVILASNFQSIEEIKIMDESARTNLSITALFFIHDGMHQGGILTIREVNTYSFTDLISNVGGTLGLFIGAALMTVAQLILFFVNHACETKSKTWVQDMSMV